MLRQGEQMQRQTKSLVVLLCLVVVLAAVFFVNRANRAPADTVMSAELSEAFRAIRAAERSPDAAQRCLTYPQPQWIHWDHTVIEAFCRSRSFKYMSLGAIKAALDAGHPEVPEQAFASYLSDNFSKPESHGILTRVYRELFGTDGEEVREVVEQWVAMAPESPYALAARGAYLHAAASDARGSNYVRETPGENFAAMGKLAAQAESDLRAAATREPKLTAAYDTMVAVGRLTGNGELVNYALGAGLREDPTDERFYLDWMSVSEPRWGGSLQAMAEVADKASALKAANPLMNLLKEKQYAYFGDMAMQAHAYTQALDYYDQGFAYGPSTLDLAQAAYVAMQLHEYERAVWYYSEAIRFDPLTLARICAHEPGCLENSAGRIWPPKTCKRLRRSRRTIPIRSALRPLRSGRPNNMPTRKNPIWPH
jgi:hypothetical protein